MKGWVYIITNQAMPGLIKIGYTDRTPDQRAKELESTGNPFPFIVVYEAYVESSFVVEQEVHSCLAPYREKGEWFSCPISYAISNIRDVAGKRLIQDFNHLDRYSKEVINAKFSVIQHKDELEKWLNALKENEKNEELYQERKLTREVTSVKNSRGNSTGWYVSGCISLFITYKTYENDSLLPIIFIILSMIFLYVGADKSDKTKEEIIKINDKKKSDEDALNIDLYKKINIDSYAKINIRSLTISSDEQAHWLILKNKNILTTICRLRVTNKSKDKVITQYKVEAKDKITRQTDTLYFYCFIPPKMSGVSYSPWPSFGVDNIEFLSITIYGYRVS